MNPFLLAGQSLTLGAVVGRAIGKAGDLSFQDRGLASWARFAAVTVHSIDGQESAFKPEDGTITGIKAGTLSFDGPFENRADLRLDLTDVCQL